MQTKHTLEPWKIVGKITSPIPADFYPILIGSKDEEGDLPLCAVHNEDSGSDARRIVACVNACAGIPIEALEDGSARAERDDIAEQLECATIMRHGWECAIERCCEAVQEVITQTHPLPQPDLEVVGLKELLEEVAKADAALSAGDTNEALNKVRTASAVASLIKSHVANRPLFRSPRPDLVAEIERLKAENDGLLDDIADMATKNLQRAWQLGQTYWQQADSEYYSQNAKSEVTYAKFRQLCDETCEAIASVKGSTS